MEKPIIKVEESIEFFKNQVKNSVRTQQKALLEPKYPIDTKIDEFHPSLKHRKSFKSTSINSPNSSYHSIPTVFSPPNSASSSKPPSPFHLIYLFFIQ